MKSKLVRILVLAISCSLLAYGMSDPKKSSEVEPPSEDENGGLVMTLVAPRPKKGRQTDNLFRLRITNKQDTLLNLDGRLLIPVIMTRVIDGSGKPVSKLSPPVPKAFEKRDILKVRGRGHVDIYFHTSQVIADRLTHLAHRIVCCYDPQGVDYPQGIKVWERKTCSNELEISR